MRNNKKRSTNKNNIIILCEGTDTEFNYFTELKEYVEQTAPERFLNIKVVPGQSERIKNKNPKRNKKRKLKEDTETLPHYWCLYERSEEEYEKYKKQPTRYIREVQLYMEDYGFTEGWAVFDKDVHPDHEFAFQLADSLFNVHIAFSSYCFEEWLLAHFEKNTHAFSHSECTSEDDKTLMCGTGVENDCKGELCLGGRLREKKFIPDYAKNHKSLFHSYTLPNLNQAIINAAWLKHLEDGPVYNRNPYTDIDNLVSHLLGNEDIHEWRRRDIPFALEGTVLVVSLVENGISIENVGSRSFVINNQNLFLCGKNYEILNSISDSVMMINKDEKQTFPLEHPVDSLLIKEGNRHFHIDINSNYQV